MVVATNFEPPTEGIRHREPNTTVFIKAKDLGKGTLYIAEDRLSWVGDNTAGFSLLYPSIQIHAVSRDVRVSDRPCIYLQVEGNLLEAEENNGTNGSNGAANGSGCHSEEDDEEDEYLMTEIRFIPADDTHVDGMFKAITDCQILHPDEEVMSDVSGEEYDVDEAEQDRGLDDGDDHHDEPMNYQQGQFDDAD